MRINFPVDRDWSAKDYERLNPSNLRAITNAMEFIRNPKKMCQEIAGYVQRMVDIINWHKLNRPNRTLYLNESWDLAERRWGKELREFRRVDKSGNVEFDISKIPDIYDNIKYDMEHNPDLCVNNEGEFERMYLCVKNMADIVVPQEYGISESSKISIAQRVCTPLLKKIRNDLHRCTESSNEDESQTRLDPRASQGIATPLRHVRTRLYFTSESHIHTLMNLIRYGGLCPVDDKKWQRAMHFLSSVTEFNYMTQVVLMVYEDSRTCSEKQGTDRFHIELLFSPGLYPCFQSEKERIYETRISNFSSSGKHLTHSITRLSSRSQRLGSDTSLSSMGTISGEKGTEEYGSVYDWMSKNCSEDLDLSSSGSGNDFTIGNSSPQAKALNKMRRNAKHPVEAVDTDDDLDEERVNLVALDEVAPSKQYTADELARHSPVGISSDGSGRLYVDDDGDQEAYSVGDSESVTKVLSSAVDLSAIANTNHNSLMKSMSDVSCGRIAQDVKWALSSDEVTNDKDKKEFEVTPGTISPTSSSRRSRFPYRFKHHTFNMLTEVDNRLISTAVLFGKLSDPTVKKVPGGSFGCPAVLSTAVIARSSSAPRLQTYKAEDEIPVGEIRRFWPPLRSLETLHDNIRFSQLDSFLERLMNNRTPLPSPPKTPVSMVTEGLSYTTVSDTISRLEMLK
ncbi:hypothetical protein AB6A40_004454 [Gnathostoma spinigerum]|uniref:Inositol hexakisphosphate and diphosphoinositol-pentakisphosphate kinase n=1 Tax=Gnathostoma spinigerum TaxID=75299 RepID=A0ABD6EN83_9BILA